MRQICYSVHAKSVWAAERCEPITNMNAARQLPPGWRRREQAAQAVHARQARPQATAGRAAAAARASLPHGTGAPGAPAPHRRAAQPPTPGAGARGPARGPRPRACCGGCTRHPTSPSGRAAPPARATWYFRGASCRSYARLLPLLCAGNSGTARRTHAPALAFIRAVQSTPGSLKQQLGTRKAACLCARLTGTHNQACERA